MYSREQNNTTHSARHGAANTPEHSNHIYLPNSSLIGDTDTVAWLRATRCTAAGRHRASQAPIACTASLQPTTPSRATNSKALLVLSGRGAAVALVAARQDLGTDCARTPWSLNEPRKLPHAEGPRACGNVLGFCRRPPCRPQSVPRIKSARASKGVKSLRIRSPLTRAAARARFSSKALYVIFFWERHTRTQPTARHYLLESRTCHILPASSPSSSARARRYLMHVSRSATLFRYPT